MGQSWKTCDDKIDKSLIGHGLWEELKNMNLKFICLRKSRLKKPFAFVEKSLVVKLWWDKCLLNKNNIKIKQNSKYKVTCY